MKKIRLIFMIFALFLVGCSEEQSTDNAVKPYNTGDEITLKSVIGSQATLIRTSDGFKLKDSDKIVMFDIFGTYCVPCQKEAPHLMDYQLKNSENFMLIGLIHFEKISDTDVIENFAKKYNAYYFISNSPENQRLVEQILADINYKRALQIPFKVVLKNGVYQTLSDNLNSGAVGNKFYLGEVKTHIISDDLKRIGLDN